TIYGSFSHKQLTRPRRAILFPYTTLFRSDPLFAIKPLDWTPPPASQFDALLLTSVNAVMHAGVGLEQYKQLPVLAIGEVTANARSEEHTSELQSRENLVCRLLLEKKKMRK